MTSARKPVTPEVSAPDTVSAVSNGTPDRRESANPEETGTAFEPRPEAQALFSSREARRKLIKELSSTFPRIMAYLAR